MFECIMLVRLYDFVNDKRRKKNTKSCLYCQMMVCVTKNLEPALTGAFLDESMQHTAIAMTRKFNVVATTSDRIAPAPSFVHVDSASKSTP